MCIPKFSYVAFSRITSKFRISEYLRISLMSSFSEYLFFILSGIRRYPRNSRLSHVPESHHFSGVFRYPRIPQMSIFFPENYVFHVLLELLGTPESFRRPIFFEDHVFHFFWNASAPPIFSLGC